MGRRMQAATMVAVPGIGRQSHAPALGESPAAIMGKP
jgi:hypothetical protein